MFTRARRREDKEVHDPLQRRRRPGGRSLQKDVRHVLAPCRRRARAASMYSIRSPPAPTYKTTRITATRG